MTEPKPYTSDFHAVPMLEWQCPDCTLTLHFKQDMGERQALVDTMIEQHTDKHRKPVAG